MVRSNPSRLTLLAAAMLAGCASTPPAPPAAEPATLASLQQRPVAALPPEAAVGDRERAISAYRDFIQNEPGAAQRPQAMRRLGDQELERGEVRAEGPAADVARQDYRAAIAMYEQLLKAYPGRPDNDRVLYQLARAHELQGELEIALAVLERLAREYPASTYLEEVNFRRGEIRFALRDYPGAEAAYATLLGGAAASPFRERALYMHGWSLYKQGRLEEGLQSFFKVLDARLAGLGGEGGLDSIPGLTRADRELVEDTFRVVSLSLQNLQGVESIPAFTAPAVRRGYEFRVYEQLAELYIRQQRVKDAADTFTAFVRRDPMHVQAPLMQARVIDIYQQGGFAGLALEAQQEYVQRYGPRSEFRQAHAAAWEQRVQPLVKGYLTGLALHFHALAQKSKADADRQQAVHWYREYLDSYPQDPQAAENDFLLAELLFESHRHAEAAAEYRHSAYDYPPHPHSADAGYAALLALAEQARTAGDDTAVARERIAAALRFAAAFPDDARAGQVLADAAERLYGMKEGEQAAQVAQQALDRKPPPAPAQRRVAWTVIGHTAFERKDYARAEQAYAESLALLAPADPLRGEITERLAASVYQQGEIARSEGRLQDAAGHFERVAVVAPQSPLRATAQYDRAATQLALKDWDGAARTLEDFRRRFPGHALQAEVTAKLAVAHLSGEHWSQAAAEFQRLADAATQPEVAREATWQVAELTARAGDRAGAVKAYERYLQRFPAPFATAIEARARLAKLADEGGDAARGLAWRRELVKVEAGGGNGRSDATRLLAARAALALTAPVVDAYRKVNLVEPLQKNLRLKKAKMEEALKAYTAASDYGMAEVATAATYQVAELYHDFSRALLASERPKKLKKDELEQYNVMLEEQAYPFEERAIELHEINAHRSAEGIYDDWVQKSYAALNELLPVRYAKPERDEGSIDAIR